MGDCTRSSRSSGLRLLLRLASLVAALCVLCVSSRASAATSPVPMCGERNESIAAPPIFRVYQAGSIAASPCHSDALDLGHPVPLSPERIVIQDRPERVLGFGALCLAQTVSLRLSIATQSGAPPRPGFADALFRPPRA